MNAIDNKINNVASVHRRRLSDHAKQMMTSIDALLVGKNLRSIQPRRQLVEQMNAMTSPSIARQKSVKGASKILMSSRSLVSKCAKTLDQHGKCKKSSGQICATLKGSRHCDDDVSTVVTNLTKQTCGSGETYSLVSPDHLLVSSRVIDISSCSHVPKRAKTLDKHGKCTKRSSGRRRTSVKDGLHCEEVANVEMTDLTNQTCGSSETYSLVSPDHLLVSSRTNDISSCSHVPKRAKTLDKHGKCKKSSSRRRTSVKDNLHCEDVANAVVTDLTKQTCATSDSCLLVSPVSSRIGDIDGLPAIIKSRSLKRSSAPSIPLTDSQLSLIQESGQSTSQQFRAWRQTSSRLRYNSLDDSDYDYRKKNSMSDLLSSMEQMLSVSDSQIPSFLELEKLRLQQCRPETNNSLVASSTHEVPSHRGHMVPSNVQSSTRLDRGSKLSCLQLTTTGRAIMIPIAWLEDENCCRGAVATAVRDEMSWCYWTEIRLYIYIITMLNTWWAICDVRHCGYRIAYTSSHPRMEKAATRLLNEWSQD